MSEQTPRQHASAEPADRATDVERQVEEIAEQYLDRLQAGQTPDRQAIAAAHAAIADRLEPRLELVEAMYRIAQQQSAASLDTPAQRQASADTGPETGMKPGPARSQHLSETEPDPRERLESVARSLLDPPQRPDELDRLGRYRVLEVLGSGGMGCVFLAQHPVMDRKVALKVISPRVMSDPAAVTRFQREVKAVARLQHPNIVTAYDADEAGGVHFLVMEYLEGMNLAELVRRQRRLPVATAAEYIRQAALGLEHAHQQGMVHRDLKPSNLMVTRQRTVKIMDLGLARIAYELGPEPSVAAAQTALTGVQTILGTPDYMAPEQARDARSADIRADIYSLGATLYYLLSGQVPFPFGSSLDKIVAAQTSNPQPLRELVPEVPAALAEVVVRMMARNPAERYQTAADVAAALVPHTRPAPTSAVAKSQGPHQAPAAAAPPAPKPPAKPMVHRTGPPASKSIRPAQDAKSPPTPPKTAVQTESPVFDFAALAEEQPVLPRRLRPTSQHVASWKRRPVWLAAGVLAVVLAVTFAVVGVQKVLVKVPGGTLVLEVNEPGAEIVIDGNAADGTRVEIAGLGEKISLQVKDEGDHKFEVTKEGFKTKTDRFTITKGQETKLAVTLLPAATQPLPPDRGAADLAVTKLPPLREWLKEREILTVAQDGSGQFRTIQQALDALQVRQVVKILDKGPYRERLVSKSSPADVGLVSEVGTRIEIPEWKAVPAADPEKKYYIGFELQYPKGFRLSGLEIAWPKFPQDTAQSTGVFLTSDGEVVIDSCRLLRHPEDSRARRAVTGLVSGWDHRALVFNKAPGDTPTRVVLAGNTIDDQVAIFDLSFMVSILVERNRIDGWPGHGLWIPQPARDVTVRHNVIRGTNAVNLMKGSADLPREITDAPFLIANNFLDAEQAPVFDVYWNLKQPPRRVRIENNIMRSRAGAGISINGDELAQLRSAWRVGHNCYEVEPMRGSFGLAVFPKQDTDMIATPEFLSEDPGNANYLRIPLNSPLATAGAGGDLPSYIGPWPPGVTRTKSAPAPDLSKVRPIFNDNFDDPASGWVTGTTGDGGGWTLERGYANGRYYLLHPTASGWGFQAFPGAWGNQSNIACEVVGRRANREANRWSLGIHADKKAGVNVHLKSDGTLELEYVEWTGADWIKPRPFDPIKHPAIKGGEAFDTLLVILRGRRLELYVNSVAVCDPVTLDQDVTPSPLFLSGGGEKGARLEFERVTVWSGEGLPALQAAGAAAIAKPVPADALRREDIPPYELAVVGGGDPQKAPAELVAILGNSRLKHWEFVYCVAFSPDSRMLASGGTDQSVKIWDVATGDERSTLLGHTGIVRAVAFSPDGRILASSGDDRTVKLWDVQTGRLLKDLPGHAGGVNCLAFSPDGRTVASGSGGLNDKSVKLWDVAAGKEAHTLADHASGVSSIAFSPDQKTLVSSSWDDTVKIWDVASGELLRTVSAKSDGVLSLAFSGKGDVLVTAGQNGMFKIWDTATWKVIREIKARGGRWYSVAMSQDGQTIATTSYADANDTVQLWDANTGERKRILAGHTQWPERVAISPDGKWVAAATWDSTVKIWDAATGELRVPANDMSCVYCVAVSPDGRTLASGSEDHRVRLWDIAGRQVRHRLPGHTAGINWLAFSKDGRQLASASWDNTVRLWDVDAGNLITTIPAHDWGVTYVAFGQDAQTLVTGSDDDWVKIWDVATRQTRRTLREYAGVNRRVGLSPDGRLLASPRDKDIRLFDLATGKDRSLPRTHTGKVVSVAFAPDGKSFASVSHDGTIRVWDTAKEQVLRTFEHPNLGVGEVTFSPDGQRLAAAGSDGKVWLWNLRSGALQKKFTLGPPGGTIWNVAFTPDGRHLATANRNGTVYVLRLAE